MSLEFMCQMILADVRVLRKLIQRNGFRQVRLQIIDHLLKTGKETVLRHIGPVGIRDQLCELIGYPIGDPNLPPERKTAVIPDQTFDQAMKNAVCLPVKAHWVSG